MSLIIRNILSAENVTVNFTTMKVGTRWEESERTDGKKKRMKRKLNVDKIKERKDWGKPKGIKRTRQKEYSG